MSTSPRAPRTCRETSVVVVVDEDTFRIALAENLRDDGHPVHDCPDPLAVGRLDDVDVVVTDYEMESMNGLAFADMVHATQPAIRIVLVTAYWTAEVEDALAARPFVRLHRKPVDYDALHAVVDGGADDTAAEEPRSRR